MQLNLKGNSGFAQGFIAFPEGRYGVTIKSCKPGVGKDSGNPKVSVQYQVEEDPMNAGRYVGRIVFQEITLVGAGLGRIVDLLLASGYTSDEIDSEHFEFDPPVLIGKRMIADVDIRELPRDKSKINGIKRLMPYSAEHLTGGPVSSTSTTTHGQLDWTAAAESYDEDPEYNEDPEAEVVAPQEVVAPEPVLSEYVIPDNLKISAKAKEYAIQHRVDMSAVTATGPGNTVTLSDIKTALGVE